MNYKQSFACLVMVACAFLAGCIGTESKYPLSSVESAVADPGVIGTWLASDGKEKLTIKIESAGEQFPKNMLRLSEVGGAKEEFLGFCYITKMKGTGKHENVHCVNTVEFKQVVKDQSLLSLDLSLYEPEKWNPDQVASYQIFAYKMVDGVIEVFDVNQKFLSSAVKAGTIKKEKETEDPLFAELGFEPDEEDRVLLDEPTDGLNKFFQANLEKIFPKVTIKMARKK